ncbi:diacylglycerol kinase family protein [Roseivirga misakiensis]|uniref:Diacylglycerol kinase n=1 Tax=Roseivirga misakiensis TaxID=1563681 RepID=A0A1E5T146_9BACT|nr:diacylglycerol kinase family protein [Roseivirga misakiensis]OEK05086.1 diacylglycerol kinase [Roseivirga misakiensis]
MKPFSVKERLQSFKYAWRGIRVAIWQEHNFRIHLLAALIVIVTGFYFEISNTEWCWIVLAICIVFTAELFNTAIEKLVDLKSPEFDPLAGKIKDIAAGAVLVSALSAAIIGLLIFWPYIEDIS